jgi:hypothetical protein
MHAKYIHHVNDEMSSLHFNENCDGVFGQVGTGSS